ncbi:MAG: formylmethanofuran dehydrogenase subunit C [Burkholderiales bacterium]
MSAITFALRDPPAHGIDCSPLVPDLLAGKRKSDIDSIELICANRKLRCAELFEVSGDDASHVAFRGGSDRLQRIGAGMKSGRLTVEGDCGAHAGAGLRGGHLLITGSAGAYAACAMRGGIIEIRGNAGDFLGAALPGDKQGMRGGAVIVKGNAGDRCGDRMRRGLLLIEGNCGAFCGSRMLAGTILVKGLVGHCLGFALRRGTLLLESTPALPVTFQDSGEHSLLFLALLGKQLAREGGPFASFATIPVQVRRYCGDLAAGGVGEILVGV